MDILLNTEGKSIAIGLSIDSLVPSFWGRFTKLHTRTQFVLFDEDHAGVLQHSLKPLHC